MLYRAILEYEMNLERNQDDGECSEDIEEAELQIAWEDFCLRLEYRCCDQEQQAIDDKIRNALQKDLDICAPALMGTVQARGPVMIDWSTFEKGRQDDGQKGCSNHNPANFDDMVDPGNVVEHLAVEQ